MDRQTIRQTIRIAAPPAEVGTAIASPHGLATWLCDDARIEKRAGGRLLFSWHDGRRLLGRWVTFEPASHLAWTWRRDDEDVDSEVHLALAPAGDAATEVTLEHHLPAAASETWSRHWPDGLDALKVYVETGRNARELRRPMLGISPDMVTPEMVQAKGLAVDHGILLVEVLPERGAKAAGLQKDDVLVALGEHPLTDWGSLTSALDRFRAGDVVAVEYWRGNERQTLEVRLSAREAPDVATAADQVEATVRDVTTRLASALEEALAGVSEDEARFTPADGEWSICEVLTHLSQIERYAQDAFCRRAVDDTPSDWAMAAFDLRQAIVKELPLAVLAPRLLADLRESEAVALAVLARGADAGTRYDLATTFHFSAEHTTEHIDQIKANVAAARGAAA